MTTPGAEQDKARAAWLAGLKVGDTVSVVSHSEDKEGVVEKVTYKTVYVSAPYTLGKGNITHQFHRGDGRTQYNRLEPDDDHSKADRAARRARDTRVKALMKALRDATDDELGRVEVVLAGTQEGGGE